LTSEDEAQVHFVSLGTISEKTRVTHQVQPNNYRWYVPLGKIDPNWPNGLELPVIVHLYVFMPMPSGWQNTPSWPHFVSHELWIRGPGGQSGEVVGLTHCNETQRDTQVKFERTKTFLGETWNISPIDLDHSKDHWRLRRLIHYYRHELQNASSVVTITGEQLPDLD